MDLMGVFLLNLSAMAMVFNFHQSNWSYWLSYSHDFLIHCNSSVAAIKQCFTDPEAVSGWQRWRGGILQRLRRLGLRRLPLPSIVLGKVRSLRNRVDELQVNMKHIPDYTNACVITLTETWLKDYDQNQFWNWRKWPAVGLIVMHRSLVDHWEGACAYESLLVQDCQNKRICM